MKNKKGTYLLLVIVLVIWGAVIYRLFFQNKSGDAVAYNNHSFVPEAVDLSSLNDTFAIHFNYRDPFLGKTIERKSKPASGGAISKPIVKPAPVLVSKWPVIVFHGLIRNQTSGKQVAWIVIDNHSFNMTPGAIQMGVELKRCFKDSVVVVFNAEKKTIKK